MFSKNILCLIIAMKERQSGFLSLLFFYYMGIWLVFFLTYVDKYYGPLHYSRQDHVAHTIMKGRDYGLPDYNTVRENIGLRRINSFEDINPKLARENPSVYYPYAL